MLWQGGFFYALGNASIITIPIDNGVMVISVWGLLVIGAVIALAGLGGGKQNKILDQIKPFFQLQSGASCGIPGHTGSAFQHDCFPKELPA